MRPLRVRPLGSLCQSRLSSSLLPPLRKPILRSAILAARNQRDLATDPRQQSPVSESADSKEKVVILGSGWGGYVSSRRLSPKHFAPTVVSPRPYFLFTPLLTSATGGSLDFSHIVEPIRSRKVPVEYIQAAARGVNFQQKTVLCEAAVIRNLPAETSQTGDEEVDISPTYPKAGHQSEMGRLFQVPYDKLVIAAGTISQTFNTPGVQENAMFFRDINDGRRVKQRIQECFELAVLPTTDHAMRECLLHFAIVGAGPTGTELAASLRDFIYFDLVKLYPSLGGIPRITLYDVAPTVLSMFDERLSRYAMDTMKREGIGVKTSHHVESLRWGAPGTESPTEKDPGGCLTLKTKEEGEVGIGMCVWATGSTMNPFINNGLRDVEFFPTGSAQVKNWEESLSNVGKKLWHVKKDTRTGALLVDGLLRVQLEDGDGRTAVLHDVFAIGDNAVPELGAPPATAQATYQEAKWLASRMNEGDIESAPPFSFRNMGMLAYVGDSRALMQIPRESETGSKYLPEGLTGRMAWFIWRSAYLTMSMSWRNKLRVAYRWLLNSIFGRDVS